MSISKLGISRVRLAFAVFSGALAMVYFFRHRVLKRLSGNVFMCFGIVRNPERQRKLFLKCFSPVQWINIQMVSCFIEKNIYCGKLPAWGA